MKGGILMNNTLNKLKLLVIVFLVMISSMLVSSSFGYFAAGISGANNDTAELIYVGEWGLTAGAPEGIPEYVLGATYSTGDYVWWEGKIDQIVGGGYAS